MREPFTTEEARNAVFSSLKLARSYAHNDRVFGLSIGEAYALDTAFVLGLNVGRNLIDYPLNARIRAVDKLLIKEAK